ncbi:homoserine dehydrogenase-like protein [Leptomonas pyrrhocoris]|uniref:Homoserine dehydrogenase n=1 Tax=Leptomonas pyrrhocoris TaxID=157538 RepID=A0A0N0DQF2_LEPPY|nr:homoserine dehydrogenase-like protein [Leptomonas pyrrhocoris]KPA73192.1 homoserine dehydrogenase-like protein [Leptomonas pyrrhocoris]|eukprot:XP_015651631.1 homoserine dehydrogenase-like protein [Leptomonas pyrrhocoris]
MPIVRGAIIGAGTVGQGVYNIAQQRREELKQKLGGAELVIVKILVTDLTRPDRVLPPGLANPAEILTDSIDEVFRADVHVVFEAAVGEEPIFTYLQRAIVEHGCSVITANKVMFARYGAALQELASVTTPPPTSPFAKVFVGFEATVAAGLPIIKPLQSMCFVHHVRKLEGILNSTSNYILTELRLHPERTFAEVVATAQALGYAETDPTNDISGSDAFMKLLILLSVAFGQQPDRASIPVVGIDSLTPEMLREAAAKGLRYRHIVRAELQIPTPQLPSADDGACGADTAAWSPTCAPTAQLVCSVRPQLVGPEHPLYGMDGTTSALSVWTDYLGCVTINGPGAGMYPTASGMMEDYAVWMHAYKRAAPAA